MKNPPVLVAVLGFFVAMAGFSYLFLGLQLLGFDWFGLLGELPRYESVGLWGWLALATGLVWLMVAFGLWALQPWARVIALVVAGFALLEAVLAMLQFTGSGVGFAMALMPLLILWYLSTRDVKAAFGEGAPAEAAPVAEPPSPSLRRHRSPSPRRSQPRPRSPLPRWWPMPPSPSPPPPPRRPRSPVAATA